MTSHPRVTGKTRRLDALAEDFLTRNPGAKLARVSIVDGEERVQVTEARGELHQDADGVYRSRHGEAQCQTISATAGE
jgi:hypothetical protein